MNEVTRILSAIEQGDPSGAEQLLPLVYDELRRLAAGKLAQENPGQTLEATALVHEAYLRLVDVDRARHWKSRGHFYAAAAEAMRPILVDRARPKRAEKPGGRRAPAASPASPSTRRTWPPPRTPKKCWRWTKRWPGWPRPTPRRRHSSSSATSPACPSPRRPRL